MSFREFTAVEIDSEIEAAGARLRESGPSTKRGEGPNLTGLELLGLLGAKVVLPILCGFISRVLYDKYKDLQTVSKAEQAKQEILAHQGPAAAVVDEATMREDLLKMLSEEGVATDRAEQVIEETIRKVRARTIPA